MEGRVLRGGEALSARSHRLTLSLSSTECLCKLENNNSRGPCTHLALLSLPRLVLLQRLKVVAQGHLCDAARACREGWHAEGCVRACVHACVHAGRRQSSGPSVVERHGTERSTTPRQYEEGREGSQNMQCPMRWGGQPSHAVACCPRAAPTDHSPAAACGRGCALCPAACPRCFPLWQPTHPSQTSCGIQVSNDLLCWVRMLRPALSLLSSKLLCSAPSLLPPVMRSLAAAKPPPLCRARECTCACMATMSIHTPTPTLRLAALHHMQPGRGRSPHPNLHGTRRHPHPHTRSSPTLPPVQRPQLAALRHVQPGRGQRLLTQRAHLGQPLRREATHRRVQLRHKPGQRGRRRGVECSSLEGLRCA